MLCIFSLMPWLLHVWMLSMRDFLRTNHIAQRDSRWSQMMPAQRPQIAVNKHQPVLSYLQPQKTHPVERATHLPNQSSSLPVYVFSHGLQGETPPWPAAQACHLESVKPGDVTKLCWFLRQGLVLPSAWNMQISDIWSDSMPTRRCQLFPQCKNWQLQRVL